MHRWWFSFTDSERPKGQQFIGACIATGATLADAITASHLRGANPGGAIGVLDLPDEMEIPEHDLFRLMQREEAEGWKPANAAELERLWAEEEPETPDHPLGQPPFAEP